MAQKPLSEQSLEELNTNKSRMQGLAIAGVVVWLAMLALLFYKLLYSSKAITSSLPMLIILPVVFIPIFKNLAETKAELKSRKTNDQNHD